MELSVYLRHTEILSNSSGWDERENAMRSLMLFAGAMLMSVAARSAPGDVFLMQIPSINGGVTRSHYSGWIAVNAFSAGISDTAGVNTGGGGGSGKVTCDPLVVIKPLDATSPELAAAAGTGEHFATVTLAAISAGGEQREFVRFTLKNAIVTSIHFGGDSVSSSRTETVSISAREIQITATPQLDNGSLGTPVTTNISCSAANL